MDQSINMDLSPTNRGESYFSHSSSKYFGLQLCNDDEIEDSIEKSKRIGAILRLQQIDSHQLELNT